MKYILLALIIRRVLGDDEINRPPKVFYDIKDARNLFDKYMVEFNKQYDDSEYEIRLEIFKKNLKVINQFNEETKLTVYRINHFTDVTNEEQAMFFMGINETIPSTDRKEYNPSGTAPSRLDYREKGFITEVKNQGACYLCYIFSAIGNIEGQLAKTHGVLISLSEQQVLDCDPGGYCLRGGFPTLAMEVLAKQEGAMRSRDYPYVMEKGMCRTDPNKTVVKVTGGFEIHLKGEEDLKDALAFYGPLSIGLTVCDRFQDYGGGLFHYNCQGHEKHNLLLVGYDTAGEIPYWILKNSWSTKWGEQGYMRMVMGKSLCNIGSSVACATVA